MSTDTRSVRPVVSMVAGATALATFGVAVAAWKEMGGLDPATAKRSVAIAIGAVMMVAGNALPKLLPPLGGRRKGPLGAITAERFAGWTFVLGGIFYVAVLLMVAPIEYAMPAASLIGLVAFAIAGANWLWVLLGDPSRVQRTTSDDARSSSPENRILELSTQMALLNLLFACFWVFTTFLVDAVWGDSASRGMAWAFMILLVIGNGLLLPIVIERTEASRPKQ